MPEVLRIVIAVACLILLVYLAVRLYELFTLKSDLEKARAELDNIIGKARVVTEEKILSYLVVSSKDWRLIYYPEDYKLCLCPKSLKEEQKNICYVEGACKNIDFSLKIMKQCNPSGENILNCLPFEKVPFGLFIEKYNGEVTIKTDNEKKWNDLLSEEIVTVAGERVPVTIDLSEYLDMIKVPDVSNGFTAKLYSDNILYSDNGQSVIVLKIDNVADVSKDDSIIGLIQSDGSLWLQYKFRLNVFYYPRVDKITFDDKIKQFNSFYPEAYRLYDSYYFYKSNVTLSNYNVIKSKVEAVNPSLLSLIK